MLGSRSIFVHLGLVFLSLLQLSCTTPINTPFNIGLTLPQCLGYAPSAPAAPIAHYTFRVHGGPTEVVLGIAYCPDLIIPTAAISHTLYRSLWTLDQRVKSEGYNAPLGGPFNSVEEKGYNCAFSMKDDKPESQVSVGAVADVLSFLWKWMVRAKHEGSAILIVYINGVKVATGSIGPRRDPVLVGTA
ncbi:MAG: hypothetical protein Q9222_004374 [Ikaeria aurantiellina]